MTLTTEALRRNLRRQAEEIIRGRQQFEAHHLGGRKSSKPLRQIKVDPHELLQLLGDPPPPAPDAPDAP